MEYLHVFIGYRVIIFTCRECIVLAVDDDDDDDDGCFLACEDCGKVRV
jgi:hypothetical protein